GGGGSSPRSTSATRRACGNSSGCSTGSRRVSEPRADQRRRAARDDRRPGIGRRRQCLARRATVTTETTDNPGEAQARRLERVYEQAMKLLREPTVASRLRAAPGENEWSAMQALGHMTEMIPYWLHHCRALIGAIGAPPTFGRTTGSPERLAGVAHGASAAPDALLAQLSREVHAPAPTIPPPA